jgi:ABC-type sugar transport system ATPase subunit
MPEGDSARPATTQRGGGSALLRLEGIHVVFGGTTALVDETFEVRPGEIVGLLGHNGAGKSTLVNVASGAVRPQRGTMIVDDRLVALRGDPHGMEQSGIKVIHQEPALADNLSIYDNITLGRDEESLPRGRRRKRAREALALLGSTLDVDRPVGSLEFGEKQIVDLARALSTSLRVLFLDEPTGALGQKEADRLHDLLRTLAAQDRGIVYISHRLRDILSVCTRLVVLRGGRVVLDRPASGFGLAELSEALAPGLKQIERREHALNGERPTLSLAWHNQRLEFAPGEITGLFGMAAGPQFRLCEALFGVRGQIEADLDGVRFAPRSPRDAIANGVYYVSANRDRDGLLSAMSALDNLLLPWLDRHRKFGIFSHSKAAVVYDRARRALNIRGGHMDAPAGALSGGNRQKLVVGRWLYGDRPKALLLSQPTQGVDVGARTDIAVALRRLAEEGVAILVASSEADEIALLCDRSFICEGQRWVISKRGRDWEERLLQGLVRQADTHEK